MVTRPSQALLAVDVGNTNTVLGMYEDGELLRHWRLTTRRDATADEIVLSVRGLLEASGGREAPREVIVASVVPSLKFSLRQALRQIAFSEQLVERSDRPRVTEVGWTPVRFVTASRRCLPYPAGLTSEESVDNGLRRMYLSQHGGKGVVLRCALTLPYNSNEGCTT